MNTDKDNKINRKKRSIFDDLFPTYGSSSFSSGDDNPNGHQEIVEPFSGMVDNVK